MYVNPMGAGDKRLSSHPPKGVQNKSRRLICSSNLLTESFFSKGCKVNVDFPTHAGRRYPKGQGAGGFFHEVIAVSLHRPQMDCESLLGGILIEEYA